MNKEDELKKIAIEIVYLTDEQFEDFISNTDKIMNSKDESIQTLWDSYKDIFSRARDELAQLMEVV